MRFVLKQALCLVLLFPQFILHAQKTVTVHGEYTYVVPGDESLDQAKVTALERAKISILADTFGTVVGATSTIAVATENGSSDISQFTLGESSVKGEWIETIGEPEYHILYSDTGLVINVKVRGKAREIVSAGVDVRARILRNGTDDRFEAETRLWDNYYTDYRAVVWLAKEHGIPFIATNVPRRYANSVKNGGLEALEAFSEEARRYIAPLPIPFEYDEGKSREAFGMMLMMGGKTAGDLRLLAEAQAVKDATMAWFISRHLDGKFLHLNGSYHSDFKEGIIPYLLKYRPETTLATVTFLRAEDISRLGEEQKGRADFYVCIPETMVTSY